MHRAAYRAWLAVASLLLSFNCTDAPACFPATGKAGDDAQAIRLQADALGWSVGVPASITARTIVKTKVALYPKGNVAICLSGDSGALAMRRAVFNRRRPRRRLAQAAGQAQAFMKAALPCRPARIILTAAILYGVAGCNRESERQQTAAESASPATPPVAARPDYMTEHVAKDAALSDALIGTWSEVITDNDGTQLDAVLGYAADRTLTVVDAARNKPDNRYSRKGTWSVAQGFLTRRVTPEGSDKTVTASDEILRIDKGEFVYVDGEEKKTKIATRVAPEKLAAAPAAPPPPQPQAVAATAPAAETPFFDDTLFVANEDVQTHIVHVTASTQIRLSVEIEEKVPINIVAQRGRGVTKDLPAGSGRPDGRLGHVDV